MIDCRDSKCDTSQKFNANAIVRGNSEARKMAETVRRFEAAKQSTDHAHKLSQVSSCQEGEILMSFFF